MLTTPELFARLEKRRVELGLTQVDVGARALNHTDGSALQNMKRGSSPTVENLSRICDVLGLQLYVGLPIRSQTGLAESDTETDFARTDAARGDYFAIPWHRPGLGPAGSPIAFQHKWMSDQALIPDRLRAVVPDELLVSGVDPRGALVVIDTAAARRATNDLWCYDEKGKLTVARLAFDRGTIIISRDQPAQAPRLLLEADISTVTLLGRVVWIGSLV
jgi:transcriptional regulator with XRE-family HTH domain